MYLHHFLHLALTAMLSITALSTPNITEGEGFGFELQNITLEDGTQGTKWVPSQYLLDEQQARMENFYIRDPITNKTIPNPENDLPISKRKSFNPYNGAECRMVFMHHHNIAQCCGGLHCEDCSYETSEFRILDHKNPGTNFVVFDIPSDKWEYYKLDGHRGWWGQAVWAWDKWYAIDAAFGHIEGQTPDRNMKSGSYCWYSQGSAWWGYYGEAACTSWCSSFNW